MVLPGDQVGRRVDVAGHRQVLLHFLELGRIDLRQRVLLAVHDAGLQRHEDLGQRHRRRIGAVGLEHLDAPLALRHAQLHAGQVGGLDDRLGVGGDVAKAVLPHRQDLVALGLGHAAPATARPPRPRSSSCARGSSPGRASRTCRTRRPPTTSPSTESRTRPCPGAASASARLSPPSWLEPNTTTLALLPSFSLARRANSLADSSNSEPGPPTWPSLSSICAAAGSAKACRARRRRGCVRRVIHVSGLLVVWGSIQAGRGRVCGEVVHRGLHAAAGQLHAGQLQAHLDAGQRGHQRQVVAVAEVADAEHAALDAAQAGAQRQVEALVDQLAQRVGIDAAGRDHAGQHRRVHGRVGALDRQAPGLAPRRAPPRPSAGGARRSASSPWPRIMSSDSCRPYSRLVLGV